MQIGNNILIFSPHFDDAVFSCGGSIINWVKQGKQVFVCTIFSGAPDYGDISEFAGSLIVKGWMENRVQENSIALKSLLVSESSLGFPEALFRKLDNGSFERTSWEEIFSIKPDYTEHENNLLAALYEKIKSQFDLEQFDIFLPLAIGGHIDHHLTFRLSEYFINHTVKKNKLFFYEDLPYAGLIDPGEDGWLGLDLLPSQEEINLDKKLSAVKFYGLGLKVGAGEETIIKAIKRRAENGGSFSGAVEYFWRYKL